MLGLGLSFARQTAKVFSYVKDSLKAYFRFYDTTPDFLLDGSTSFDGSNDYIELASDGRTDFANQSFTISAWVKPNAVSSDKVIFSYDYTAHTDPHYAMHLRTMSSGRVTLNYNDGSGTADSITSGNDAITAGVWQHVCTTYTSGTQKIYVNGLLVASGTDAHTITFYDQEVWIGKGNFGGEFEGLMANVGIWSRALSASEIESIQWRGSHSELKDTELTNLVSWYDLDNEELGSELVDDIVNASNWSTYGSNTKAVVDGSIQITYVDHGYGGYNYLLDSKGLTVDPTENAKYKLTFDAKITGGTTTGRSIALYNGASTVYTSNLTTSYVNYEFIFTKGGSNAYIRLEGLGASNVVNIKNFSVKPYNANDSQGSNEGLIVGATVNTDSYSGESPFKPRIQDIATPKMAVQLADGSTSFDGSNDYIDLDAHIGDFSSQTTGTISLWFKTSSDGSSMSFISASDWGDASSNFSILCNIKKIQLNIRENGTYTIDAVGSVDYNDNKWHHLAFAVDGSGNKMYIDGSQISLTYSTGSASTQSWFNSINDLDTLSIGANKDNTTRVENYFNGSMANVAFHSSALTQSQVQELMFTEKYSGLSSDLKTNLVSWYDLGSVELGTSLITGDSSNMDTVGSWTAGSWASAVNGSVTSVSGGQTGNAIKVDTDSGRAFAKYNHTSGLTVVNGRSYRFSVWGKNGEGEGIVALAYTFGYTHYVNDASATSADGKVSTYDIQTQDTDLHIALLQASSGNSVLWDDVTVKPINVADSHGSNTGSVYGATTTTGYTSSPHGVVDPLNYGEVYSGRALDFDGSNDLVSIPDNASLDVLDGDFTIEFRIKSEGSVSGNESPFSRYLTSGEHGIYIYISSTNGVPYLRFNDSVNAEIAIGLTGLDIRNDNKWHHLVWSMDRSGNCLAFADGILLNTVDISGRNATCNISQTLTIGANSSSSQNFEGKMQNIRQWNIALSQAQVQQLFTNPEQILPTGVSASNLKIDLPMQEGAGSYIYDGSIRVGSELVVNGDMELDSNWGDVVSPAINERSTEIVRTGTYSRKIVGDSSYDGMAQAITVVAGESYLVSGWVYGDGTNKLYARAYDGGGSGYDNFWIGSSNDGIVVPAEWTYYQKIFKAVGTTFTIQILQGDTSAGGVTFYADDISLKNVTGGQNHGTISGATWVTGQQYGYQSSLVRSNTLMVFDGSDDVVAVDGAIASMRTTTGTWSAWINNPDITSAESYFLSAGDTNANEFIILIKDADGDLRAFLRDAGSDRWEVKTDSPAFTNNTWHHVVLTHNGTEPELYVDGSKPAQTFSVSTDKADWIADCTGVDNFRIGHLYKSSSAGGSFSGIMNEVAIWDTNLDADAVTQLYGSGTPLDPTSDSGNYDNSDNLQGYWRNDGITTWTDRSTNSNNGTASGSPVSIVIPEGSTSGRDNQGFLLTDTTSISNGVRLHGSDYIEVKNSEVLNVTTSATWELWMNQNAIDTSAGVIGKGSSTGSMIAFYTHSGGKFYFDIRDGNTQYAEFDYSTAFSSSTWHHLVVVYDGTLTSNANRLKVYVDSNAVTLTFVGTIPSTLPTNTDSYFIGETAPAVTIPPFNGLIDEVRIYNKALSASEVLKNYNNGKSAHQ